MATGQAAQPAVVLLRVHGQRSAGGDKVDCNWPAKDRKTTVTPRGPDAAGGSVGRRPTTSAIYIRAEHGYVTGVLGDSLTITDASVNLLEPQGYSVTT